MGARQQCRACHPLPCAPAHWVFVATPHKGSTATAVSTELVGWSLEAWLLMGGRGNSPALVKIGHSSCNRGICSREPGSSSNPLSGTNRCFRWDGWVRSIGTDLDENEGRLSDTRWGFLQPRGGGNQRQHLTADAALLGHQRGHGEGPRRGPLILEPLCEEAKSWKKVLLAHQPLLYYSSEWGGTGPGHFGSTVGERHPITAQNKGI